MSGTPGTVTPISDLFATAVHRFGKAWAEAEAPVSEAEVDTVLEPEPQLKSGIISEPVHAFRDSA